MKKELRKNLERLLNRLPSPKLLFALVVAIVLGVIVYLALLFLLSK